MVILFTTPQKVVVEGNLVVRAVYHVFWEFYRVAACSFHSFYDLYWQGIVFHLVFCDELDARLVLDLEQAVEHYLVVVYLLFQGEREECCLELRLDPNSSFSSAEIREYAE